MRRSRPCARDLYVAKTQTSQGSSSSSWSIQNSRCASAQSCASSSESALPCVSCSWQHPPVREKNSIKDQRGWLVLNPARPPAIVASGPMMQPFPLRSSPVRPNDIAQESEILPRSSVRRRQRRRHQPELHRVLPRPGDAAKVAVHQQHGHRHHPQPEHQVRRQPDLVSPADAAEYEPRSACHGQPPQPVGQESG